jgi:hypothetical protein
LERLVVTRISRDDLSTHGHVLRYAGEETVMTYDLIIRGGTVVDGTGAPPRTADIAVIDGVVAEVGRVDGSARRTVDADGLTVTPGFVDVHTHFDGQATWDPHLTPSCWHGVTTAIMGNCGIGFAPVRPDRHEWLIELMEGVEDIPGSALSEGITWEWESFGIWMLSSGCRVRWMWVRRSHLRRSAGSSWVIARMTPRPAPILTR